MRVLKYRKREGKRLGAVRHQRKAERVTMPVTKGDSVRVMRGEDKGKEGKVLRVFTKTGRVTVEGINIVKKHRKARTADDQSGIIEAPAPVHSSNLMLLDAKTGDPTRTKARIDTDGTKERVGARTGEPIPRVR